MKKTGENMKNPEENIFINEVYLGRVIIVEPTDLFIKCSFDVCNFVGIEGNLGVFEGCYFEGCNLTDRQALDLNISSNMAHPNPLIEVELSEKERRDIISFDIAMSAIEAMFGWAGDNCKWYHYALMIAFLSPLIYDFIPIFMGAQ